MSLTPKSRACCTFGFDEARIRDLLPVHSTVLVFQLVRGTDARDQLLDLEIGASRLLHLPYRRLQLRQLADVLAPPAGVRKDALGDIEELPPAPATVSTPSRQRASSDALLAITPQEYVPALTGQALGRDHKISCPFHEDRTPSLHAYPTADRGWYCYSCCRGGSIYDLAAALWELGTRGSDFQEMRSRLSDRFVARRGEG